MTDRLNGQGTRAGKEMAAASKWAAAMLGTRKGSLSWADCGAEDLLAAVAHVTEDGAALLLAKTSDGGALMVQVLLTAGDRPKFYAASMSELNELLAALARV